MVVDSVRGLCAPVPAQSAPASRGSNALLTAAHRKGRNRYRASVARPPPGLPGLRVDALVVGDLDEVAIGVGQGAHIADRRIVVDRLPLQAAGRLRLTGRAIRVGATTPLHP